MLKVENLCCERGYITLFEHISFIVGNGQGLYITGDNGVGKSTLLRSLAGLFTPLYGTITWHGWELDADAHAAGSLFYMGHKNGISLELTPSQNLEFLMGVSDPGSERSCMDALDQMGMSSRSRIACHQLSAGQLRRIALAHMVLRNADVWLLDEPATALDRDGTTLLDQLMQKHLQAGGLIILTSHQELPVTGMMQRLHLQSATEALETA